MDQIEELFEKAKKICIELGVKDIDEAIRKLKNERNTKTI